MANPVIPNSLGFFPMVLGDRDSLHFEQMVLSCEWKVVEMIWIQNLCSIVGIWNNQYQQIHSCGKNQQSKQHIHPDSHSSCEREIFRWHDSFSQSKVVTTIFFPMKNREGQAVTPSSLASSEGGITGATSRGTFWHFFNGSWVRECQSKKGS